MEFKPLLWPIFNKYRGGAKYHDDIEQDVMVRFLWAVASVIPTMLLSFAVSVVSAYLVILVVAIAVALIAFGPMLGRLHPLNKMDRWLLAYRNKESSAWLAGRRYYELNRSDRSQFHPDIIKILADPDLTRLQRDKLVREMTSTLDKIDERDRSRRILVERQVDIESVLEYIRDQRQGLQAEIDTYKEFNASESVPELSGRRASKLYEV